MLFSFILCVVIALFSSQLGIADVPETMSYQGVLTDASDKLINGNYDLTFRLYANQTDGSWLWSETHTSVSVNKGIFNVILGSKTPLDITFDMKYWLGVTVGAGPELPRIELTSSPYSLNAQNVSDGVITTSKLADDAVTIAKIKADVVSSVDGVSNDGGDIDLIPGPNITIAGNDAANIITIGTFGLWKLGGNDGTDSASDFLGTIDNKVLELRVNNIRALRLEPDDTSPNVVGGFSGNKTWLEFGAYGTTISGGGESGSRNLVTDNYGTVGGGLGNRAGNADEITNNIQNATVGGGNGNIASGANSTIGGGYKNEANGHQSTVGGGDSNKASGSYSATVGGGNGNTASGTNSTVGGGYKNEASGHQSTVCGGSSSNGSGSYSTVAGGSSNIASGIYSTVAGGYNNKALGDYSFAIGMSANADEHGSFIFADSTNIGPVYFNSRYPGNDFSVLCTGGARFVTQWNPSNGNAGGVNLPAGGSAWSSLCDRNAKANFAQVNGCETLKLLASIPIQTWNYKAQDPSIRHIGPMAQDFYEAFGMGEDDKHISTIDADGVALAAIQGLYEIVKEKDEKIEQQEDRIAQLEARLAALEKLISSDVKGD